MPTTLADIARRAGVSTSTVSHVINGTRFVSPALQERVLVAMNELGYRRNAVARSLRQRRTMAIGLVIPDGSNPFFAEIARGIEDVCFQQGYRIIICNSDEDYQKEAEYLDALLERRVDGVIAIVTRSAADNLLTFKDYGLPIVVVDRDVPDVQADSVLVDNRRGGYLAGEHLASQGYRRIGVIIGPLDRKPQVDRLQGFRDGLQASGLTLDPALIAHADFQYEGGRQALFSLLERAPDIDAVFAGNDRMAIGAMRGAWERGHRVPDDLAVVGFDDILAAAYTVPALTTIAQPKYEMGQRAAETLLRRLQNPDLPLVHLVLQPSLVVRESSVRRGRQAMAIPPTV